ncbi:MAG: hypothetical protein V1725_07125 [archaeon]
MKRQKHDKYIDCLCERLSDEYDHMLRNVPIYDNRRRKRTLVAEVDILAFKEEYCDIYEVKCSFRMAKAKKQLDRICRLISKRTPVKNVFFYCGESGRLLVVPP